MTLIRNGLLVAALAGTACDGSKALTAPSALASVGGSTLSGAPVTDAANEPQGLQPTITRVSPDLVSTSGTWGAISGTQFEPGARVTIGQAAVVAWVRDATTIQFADPGAHAPGTVDVTVTNPGGRSAVLVGGYHYAPPASFEVNGEWVAHADAHNDYLGEMHFTIDNNRPVSLSCGTPVTAETRCRRQR